LCMFAIVSCVFASVSYACSKYFICLQTKVANVASECFKNRSGVAHIAMRVRSGGRTSSPCAWSDVKGDIRVALAPHGRAKRRRGGAMLARAWP
jgi:hypothetical protein